MRVPQAFAEEVGLEEGGEVELSLIDGKLVLSPSCEEWSLDWLVAGSTQSNVHSEIGTGPPMGKEIW